MADDPSCPLCGATDVKGLGFPYETHWRGIRFTHRCCRQCSTVYRSPLPTDAQRRETFSWANYHSAFITAPYNPAALGAVLDGLRRVKPPPARLLDFGTGHGDLLMAARDAGYEAHGVEFEDEAIVKAEQRSGCPVSTLEHVEHAGYNYDIVQLSNVLVALPAPRETVGRLLKLLRPGGCFSIDQALESNPRFELLAMAGFKRARRALGLDHPPDSPPTLLWRTNATAQRHFFARVGCTEVFFHVSDDGWPYHTVGVTPSSLGGKVKAAIGRTSIAISASPVGRALTLGDRCRGVFAAPVAGLSSK